MSRHTDRLEIISIDKLIPYANNARTHSDEQIKKIQASLREFGFVNPVLIDKDCGIIAGHARVEAAKREGLTEVPCVWVEHLTEAQKKAYILADNRLAEDAGWDFELLSVELEELKELDFDIGLTGFGADELSDIFGEEEFEAVEDDYEVELPEEPKTKLGDIYQLGRHRLMCGDSTMIVDVEKLMDGKKADMVFTDPPYGFNYVKKSDGSTIQNDGFEFAEIIKKAIENIDSDCDLFICGDFKTAKQFLEATKKLGEPKSLIIWSKPLQHRMHKFENCHEFIWYWGKNGMPFYGRNVFECKRQIEKFHPTIKPQELIEYFLKSDNYKNVLDLFGGSGSTLIACEQLNRNCYMMELDPKYCDVIIDRWEQFTGEKAVLLNESR
jgi:DNA modification methylase